MYAQVDFGTSLDLSPYLSHRPAVPALYDLYGVLVHSGHSVHSGHYYCFVRSGTGMWHVCDDTQVSQVGLLAPTPPTVLFFPALPRGRAGDGRRTGGGRARVA